MGVMKTCAHVNIHIFTPSLERLNDVGNIPVGNTPEEFGTLIKSEIALLGDIFRKAGVSAN